MSIICNNPSCSNFHIWEIHFVLMMRFPFLSLLSSFHSPAHRLFVFNYLVHSRRSGLLMIVDSMQVCVCIKHHILLFSFFWPLVPSMLIAQPLSSYSIEKHFFQFDNKMFATSFRHRKFSNLICCRPWQPCFPWHILDLRIIGNPRASLQSRFLSTAWIQNFIELR